MKVLQKIFKARRIIKSSNLTKVGRNEHSKYDYYTPEQVNKLVNDACEELQLLNIYQLKRTDLGLIGVVTVYDLESGEKEEFTQATEIPQITATNIAQQLGGAVTYSERYILMSIYDIKDNNLDFDTPQRKPDNKQKIDNPATKTNFETRLLTQKEVDEKWNGIIYKGNIVYVNNTKIVSTIEQIEKLKTHPKFKEIKQ